MRHRHRRVTDAGRRRRGYWRRHRRPRGKEHRHHHRRRRVDGRLNVSLTTAVEESESTDAIEPETND
ncbi:hypothetical protein C8039_09935 [Halogeometricum sp. wsp3]|nr:hypothetical protein C8039_09935 [Halogeometricum sp. wsp3]